MTDLVKIEAGQFPVQATEISLDIPEDITINEFAELGAKVNMIHKSTAWMLADLLVFGERKFKEQLPQLADEWGYSPETLRNAIYVGERWPKEERNPLLSFAHHQAVTSVDRDMAKQMLDAAVERELSVKELRALKRAYNQELSGEETIELKTLCPNCGYEL